MRNVRMHRALPVGLTYSSTQKKSARVWSGGGGWGGIHSLVPAFDLGTGGGVGGASGVWCGD